MHKTYEMFRMLGQERRFKVMHALTQRAMSHGELSAMFDAPGIWPHIEKLEKVGLIIKQVFGPRDVKYRADPDALSEMSKFLDEMAQAATEVQA